MDYIIGILIGLVVLYDIYKLIFNSDIRFVIIIGLIIELIIGIILFQLIEIKTALFYSLLAVIVVSFLIIHLQHKRISLLFYFIFFLTLSILGYLSYKIPNTIIYNSIISSLIFFLSEINQRYIRKSYEESANEYQNQIIQKQVDEVQNVYLTMRGWRHDYHNHLQTLKAHISMKQYNLAMVYLNELELDLKNVNQIVESGNVNLDAILNSKLSLAMKQDIEVNYKATVPNTLTVSDIDLCILIGNLIDNAVEACEKIKDQKKFIRLYIGVLKKQLYISITNSTSELVRKLDEEYITTKRGNHGHGLKRINNIVNKYEGYINRKNEPGVFVTQIMLPL